MRIFKNKWFAKFARKEGISDEKLIQAVQDIYAGKIDADYGGGVIKQRIARPHDGKSGGYRTIILLRQNDKAFYVYGFAKNTLENIDKADVQGFKKLAKIMLSVTEQQMAIMLEKGEVEEIQS
ncbi:MAG: type II toxin-antitoxin system RelE/ParE family toxin [Pyrinomonadaceae bacterium]